MSGIPRRGLVLGAAALAAPAIARAQPSWPNGPIRLVAPFPPGGSADLICRLVQAPLQASLGVPIVIENRPGASGALGTAVVARGPADGQSFVLVFDSHVVNPALNPTLGFDPEKDLRAVMLVATAPMLVTTPVAKPYRTLAEVVTAAKAGADRISFGTVGVGSLAHLTMERLQQVTGTQMIHIPYRGGGPMSTAAMAGEIDLAVASVVGLGGQVGTSLRPLAQSGATRSPMRPDIPTIAEAGIPGVASEAFWGFCAPSGVPDAVVARFNAALASALAAPAVRQPLESQGCTVVASSPEAFGRFLQEQAAIWTRVVRERHITAQ
ncbi:tripartite tricarboxylate transporter substrate-binding protein [Roseomonas sp. NAR14]|uniref:Tripartite tricarboxylate transporter substrate-binding protein n=1 Tax=Roseomonas acroporae TaxID=2937791 RepID=A0A9X2BYJ1_9PROT|nr:tripartite tricarboxylate transporter substrate-binding protein [Roseomonas acroporae]MCK8786989.1 tripartite tricarboxylate transporter substrate-binding protein [Roseomonas acroporae]